MQHSLVHHVPGGLALNTPTKPRAEEDSLSVNQSRNRSGRNGSSNAMITSAAKHVYYHENDAVKCAKSLVWKSEEAAQRAQFGHIQRLLQYIAPEQFRNPARSSAEIGIHVGPCDIVPTDFQAWVEHKTAMIEISKQEELRNISIKQDRLDARKRMQKEGIQEPVIKPVFGSEGKIFEDGYGPVLSQATIWSFEYAQLKLPQAAWPGQEQLQQDGDARENEKAQTRCGRYFPLPRAPLTSSKLTNQIKVSANRKASNIIAAPEAKALTAMRSPLVVSIPDSMAIPMSTHIISDVIRLEKTSSRQFEDLTSGLFTETALGLTHADNCWTLPLSEQISHIEGANPTGPIQDYGGNIMVEEQAVLESQPLDKVDRHKDPRSRYIFDPRLADIEEANLVDDTDISFVAHGKHLLGNQLLHSIGHWGLLFQVEDQAYQPERPNCRPNREAVNMWYFHVNTGCWSDVPYH